MRDLIDFTSRSPITGKELDRFTKTEIMMEARSKKIKSPGKSIKTIAEEVGVSASVIKSCSKEFGYSRRHRTLTTEQKQEAVLKMQLGKVKASFLRSEITEDEYKKKVSDLNSKFNVVNISEYTCEYR